MKSTVHVHTASTQCHGPVHPIELLVLALLLLAELLELLKHAVVLAFIASGYRPRLFPQVSEEIPSTITTAVQAPADPGEPPAPAAPPAKPAPRSRAASTRKPTAAAPAVDRAPSPAARRRRSATAG